MRFCFIIHWLTSESGLNIPKIGQGKYNVQALFRARIVWCDKFKISIMHRTRTLLTDGITAEDHIFSVMTGQVVSLRYNSA